MNEELADVPLTEDARRALELVLERGAAAVMAALADLRPASPVYALCLSHERSEEMSVSALMLGLEPARADALRDRGPYDAWREVWSPTPDTIEDVALPLLAKIDQAFAEAQDVLREALEEQDVFEPARWVLNRVARALTTTPMPFAVTADFLAYVLDDEFTDLLMDQLRFSATPEVLASLEAQKLVAPTVEDLPGGIPYL